jgi:hypothetical protein
MGKSHCLHLRGFKRNFSSSRSCCDRSYKFRLITGKQLQSYQSCYQGRRKSVLSTDNIIELQYTTKTISTSIIIVRQRVILRCELFGWVVVKSDSGILPLNHTLELSLDYLASCIFPRGGSPRLSTLQLSGVQQNINNPATIHNRK